MPLRLVLPVVATALLATGCGDQRPRLSALCTADQRTLARALDRAPARVALPDGTPLSRCVAAARDIGELQSFGFLITRLADRLADRAHAGDGRAALRLGYVIGAARRGAAHSQGVPAELVHRLEATARRLGAGARAPLERGLRAGERSG